MHSSGSGWAARREVGTRVRIRTRMNHNQVLSLAKLRPYIYYAHDGGRRSTSYVRAYVSKSNGVHAIINNSLKIVSRNGAQGPSLRRPHVSQREYPSSFIGKRHTHRSPHLLVVLQVELARLAATLECHTAGRRGCHSQSDCPPCAQ